MNARDRRRVEDGCQALKSEVASEMESLSPRALEELRQLRKIITKFSQDARSNRDLVRALLQFADAIDV